MRQLFKTMGSLLSAFFMIIFLIAIGVVIGRFGEQERPLAKSSILQMDLKGVILDVSQFLEDLRKYSKDDKIKGVLIRVDSPGGAVGPSQEIYAEIRRVREELQKPVVVTCGSVAASGAFYAAVAADRIVTNPGTLMGSIGVIMEFANLSRLYDWAKIEPYSIKTGAYKDSGASYRPMREDEKVLFQSLVDDVLAQFKDAVAKGRKLTPEIVNKYADGRVFTGEAAVKLGFADQVGTHEDALRILGEMTGLGSKPEVFEPPKKRPNFFELVQEMDGSARLDKMFNKVFPKDILGQPLYIMPAAVGL